jgi:hypothetical protein
VTVSSTVVGDAAGAPPQLRAAGGGVPGGGGGGRRVARRRRQTLKVGGGHGSVRGRAAQQRGRQWWVPYRVIGRCIREVVAAQFAAPVISHGARGGEGRCVPTMMCSRTSTRKRTGDSFAGLLSKGSTN